MGRLMLIMTGHGCCRGYNSCLRGLYTRPCNRGPGGGLEDRISTVTQLPLRQSTADLRPPPTAHDC